MDFHRGVVRAYDETTHTAAVLLVGSLSRALLNLPVSQQIPPDHMTGATECAVALFADGSDGLVVSTFGGAPTPGLILDAYGPVLTLDDIMRGWHDDFEGDSLDARYSTTVAGGATVNYPGTAGGAHGGDVRISTAAIAGSEACLYLGTQADTYRTLATATGWVMICKLRLSSIAGNFNACFGVRDNANNNIILGGLSQASLSSNNWAILTRSAGGAVAGTTSTIPADTNYHVLSLLATPGQIDLYVDAAHVCTRTTNVPAGVLTPYIVAYVNVATARDLYVDWWLVIPR